MATARAVTTVTVGEIEREAFESLMQTQPQVRDEIWRNFAERRFDDYLRSAPGYAHLDREARRRWFRSGKLVTLEAGEPVPGEAPSLAFLVTGALERNLRRHVEPALIALQKAVPLRATERSRVAVAPAPIPPESA